MKAVISTLTWAALAAMAMAKPIFTMPSINNIENGKPYQFTWSNATGSVTINLKQGAATDLKTVAVITSGATGTSFTWTPSIPGGTYSFEIIDSADAGNPNYVGPVQIAGPSGSLSPSGSASVTGSASASASSTTSGSSASTTSAASTSSSASSSASSSGNSTTSRATTTSAASSSAPTSSKPPSTTSVPNPNGAGSLVAPFAGPLLVLAGLAVF